MGVAASVTLYAVFTQGVSRLPGVYEPHRLAMLTASTPTGPAAGLSTADLDWLSERVESIDGIASFAYLNTIFQDESGTEPIMGARTSHNFLSLLQIHPLIGRDFAEADTVYRNPDPPLLLSYSFWKAKFGGDPAIVGKRIQLRSPYLVIGVLPESFDFLRLALLQQVDVVGVFERPQRIEHGPGVRMAVARLKEGATLDHIRMQLVRESRRLSGEFPTSNSGLEFKAERLDRALSASHRDAMQLLGYSSGFVFAIAVLNTSLLGLLRISSGARELQLKIALGGSRRVLALELMLRTALAGLAGGGLGLLFATGTIRVAQQRWSTAFPALRLDLVHVTWDLVVIAIVFGVAASLVAASPSIYGLWRHESHTSHLVKGVFGTERFRPFVAVQVALGVLLYAGAILSLRALDRAVQGTVTIDYPYVLTARVDIPISSSGDGYQTFDDSFKGIQAAVGNLPGVVAAGAMSPHIFENRDAVFDLSPTLPIPRFVGEVRIVSGDWMAVSGHRLVSGDKPAPWRPELMTVYGQVLVNESFAKMYRDAGVDPIGRSIVREGHFPGRRDVIVGVVSDARSSLERSSIGAIVYTVDPTNGMHLLVRTTPGRNPEHLGRSIRAIVKRIEPRAAVGEIRTLEDRLLEFAATPRLLSFLFTGFSVMALLMTLAGSYAVATAWATQRTREFGIRLAVGARPEQVAGLVLRQALGTALTGMAIGGAGAFAIARALGSRFDVAAGLDLETVLLASALSGTVAISASLIPARRASTIDPMIALRYD
jgi:putative ABC transport system permease protein